MSPAILLAADAVFLCLVLLCSTLVTSSFTLEVTDLVWSLRGQESKQTKQKKKISFFFFFSSTEVFVNLVGHPDRS